MMAEPGSSLKDIVRQIFATTLAELDVARAFARKIHRQQQFLTLGTEARDLSCYEKILTISFGKTAWAMTQALVEALAPEFSTRGIAVSNVPPPTTLAGFETFVAGHPYPNQQSLAAAEKILAALKPADEKTLVFFLISGGGSALVEKPLATGVTLEDMRELHRVLVNCGASIDEVNTIRKHLSAVKGGRLAMAAAPAQQVTILISDVPEGCLATIASGPTLPDLSTVEQCYKVVARYHLLPQFPASIRQLFAARRLEETPKPGAASFARTQSFLLLSSRDVFHAAHKAAAALGFLPECDLSCDEWELGRAADFLFERLQDMRREAPGKPLCLISGGEISCPVTGEGQGGRNQAFVLYCVPKIAGQNVAVLSAGTDGIDGNSPAAGAIADGETLARAREKGLDPSDYLRRADSYHFFTALDDTIVTGPLQNNLRDLRLLLTR